MKKKKVSKKKTGNTDFDTKWEDWEHEARRRAAWGNYVHTMNRIRIANEDRKYMNGDDRTRREIDEKRKNRTDLIYIG